MFDWLFDFLFASMPLRVQWGCLTLIVILLSAVAIWAYWPEAN